MGSLALALKYRPKVFSDLVGQETISQTLSMALDKDRIVHAYLFSGLRGSGKTSSARIFARALECEKGPTSTPCGECATCVATLDGKNIDIIEMDAASNRSIDSIRDLIEQTKYVPTMSRYKIFIIDEVHMLTKEAFNALLKTLEEPPAYVKFILATTDPLKLPATILSRTQHFRFKKIPHKAIIAHLEMILEKEGVGYEKGALDIIARSGGGSLRDTLTLTDQAINYCDKYLTIDQVTQMLGIVDPKSLRDFFSSIMHDDEQGVVRALEILGEYECEMIIDEMLLFLKDMLLGGSKEFSLLVIDRFLGILSQAKSLLNLNPDGAFVLLLMSLKMREAMKLQEISEAIKNLESSIALESTFDKNAELQSKQSVASLEKVDSASAESMDCHAVQAPLAMTENNTASKKVDSSNEAFSSSLRENPQGFSWQSTKTQSLESTFDKNAELQSKQSDVSLEKVDSRETAESVKTPQAAKPTLETQKVDSSPSPKHPQMYQQAFHQLVSKIADRSYELGEAFRRSIVFEQFIPASEPSQSGTLIWQSSGDEQDRALLRQHFGLIRGFVQDIFAPQSHTPIVIKNASTPESSQAPKPAQESSPSVASDTTQASNATQELDSSKEPKKLKPSDLILYSTHEIRPDHISEAVCDEVPWEREEVPLNLPASFAMEQKVDSTTSKTTQESCHTTSPSHNTSASKDSATPQEATAPSDTPTNDPIADPITEAFKHNNQALIGGIKQHFGAKSMIIEASSK
ncbi:DNA polymerase III subunit gamma/tau [Helicobacter canis]|uniref:DNA polymerase III subunit gamma/tau n=1 Tax=Helicobacter canis TaxID=29419 RepID=A0A377J518_9HELI|nr:DNA polymerase III subunit gamma/tau [Helicobacter canis]STO97419.1 DNA polymerase III subunits gamma and tau [Helicobacter canis]